MAELGRRYAWQVPSLDAAGEPLVDKDGNVIMRSAAEILCIKRSEPGTPVGELSYTEADGTEHAMPELAPKILPTAD